MLTRLINHPSQAGAPPPLPKLVEDTVLPLPIPQPIAGPLGLRGSQRVAPQGLHRLPTVPVQAEMLSMPRVLQNFELAAERAVPDYGSSGSEHDPSSVSLFAMVHEFIENEGSGEQQSHPSEAHGCLEINKDSSKVNGTAEMLQAMQSLAICSDSREETILRETQEILESINADEVHMCKDGKPATVTHSCLKRMVMSLLQKRGFNAAVCKTRWDHVCGLPAGDYEYIDVLIAPDTVHSNRAPDTVHSNRVDRLLLDIDFQSQFEIARPTDEFTTIWKLLPSVFVGRAERLKRIVNIMSDATKQSLRVKGLHLPPWRKPGYMKAKWFSSYKRTSNASSGRPCKERELQHANTLGFAVRGGGLNAKFTNTLELFYHDTGSNFLVSEDKERVSRRERDQITVIATDWQPPAVDLQSMALKKQGAMTGLSSLLLRCAPSTCKEMVVQAA